MPEWPRRELRTDAAHFLMLTPDYSFLTPVCFIAVQAWIPGSRGFAACPRMTKRSLTVSANRQCLQLGESPNAFVILGLDPRIHA